MRINLIVGPPGVGKTFLVSQLVGSILALAPSARILITAQNHDALAEMERTLRDHLETIEPDTIIVRVERAMEDIADTQLRAQTRSLLRENLHERRGAESSAAWPKGSNWACSPEFGCPS